MDSIWIIEFGVVVFEKSVSEGERRDMNGLFSVSIDIFRRREASLSINAAQ